MGSTENPSNPFQVMCLWLGPLVALLLILLVDIDPQHPEVTRTAAIGLWMAIWWFSEAVPLAVTALLPAVCFPLLHIMPGKAVAVTYINHVIFLFLGGFMIAIALERWNVHKRIALFIMRTVGVSQPRLLLGFMLASAFLSMWISNTATTLMMMPTALAVLNKLDDTDNSASYSVGLLLGIAYASSLGGMTTLIGTAPNPVFIHLYALNFPSAEAISFSSWMLNALPIALILLAIVWVLLCQFFCKTPVQQSASNTHQLLQKEQSELGPMQWEEKMVFGIFITAALLWLTRTDINLDVFTIPGWGALLEPATAKFIDDGTVALTMGLLLFIIPSKRSPSGRLLTWDDMKVLPWGIVLLLGGGFALATGVMQSGLSEWIGSQLHHLGNLPPYVMVLSICFIITFLTEVSSNTATTQLVLPILASLAIATNVHPLLVMVPATLCASCAFMLPAATPPNAIVFGSNRITVAHMCRVGIILNCVAIMVITTAMFVLGKSIFNLP